MSPFTIAVTTRGAVNHRAREQAEEKLRDIGSVVKGPILGARMVLIQEANPRIPMPARAEAEVDLQGRLVRARAAAPAMDAAIDDVTDRLQRHLRRYVDRLISREREPAQPANGEWAHRSWSPPPSETFVRPAEEREIIRRKSFAFGPMSVDEAADTLEDLDHEFFLFHDANMGADEVLYWRDDGLLALIAPRAVRLPAGTGPFIEPNWFSGPIEPAVAVAEMNAVAHRFLFFENAATGRGNVIYRRYDGHYGLIEPA
ncbi:MAG TPA: sigma 54 modulation/S30EA ribosomal C-terminal domain-containing protein [Solirubrobacteraceae bacterium]|nr:sigma 54 modulation/S30EA ribosomal C-terminal domain-containing protein [Solirubrobacteraceae bacterium]